MHPSLTQLWYTASDILARGGGGGGCIAHAQNGWRWVINNNTVTATLLLRRRVEKVGFGQRASELTPCCLFHVLQGPPWLC
jgi:hypothetical protein